MVKRAHHDLLVWQEGMELVSLTYSVVSGLPREEKFDLGSQMRRAAVSVPANIAEGAGRNSAKEFNHFLGIARGSLCELETLLILCRKLKLVDNVDRELAQVNTTYSLLNGLMKSIRNKMN